MTLIMAMVHQGGTRARGIIITETWSFKCRRENLSVL